MRRKFLQDFANTLCRQFLDLGRGHEVATYVRPTMRAVPLLFILCAGCATARISVRGARNELRFHFDQNGKPLVVSGIDVFENEQGRPGENVCTVRPGADSTSRHAILSDWVYGQGDTSSPAQLPCEALDSGQRYSIQVFHSHHCIVTMDFAISADGSAQQLGPSNDLCWM